MSVGRTAKELVRHVIFRSRLNGALIALRAKRGQDLDHLRADGLGERFAAIYRNRVWLNGRSSGSLSGLGSELGATNSIRQHLPRLFRDLDVKTLLDIGCGDFNWLQAVPLDCDYVGIDVVGRVIELDTRDFGSPRRVFHALDATRDALPPADTALCREVLFHLSFDDIRALIRNVARSGVTTLIATNDANTAINSDILSGDFRMLNLRRPPFRFPRPGVCIPDDGVSPGRVLAVWRIADLPQDF